MNGPLHIILTSLLEGATVRDMLPVENLFTYPTTTILPILCDIDKRLASVCFYSQSSIDQTNFSVIRMVFKTRPWYFSIKYQLDKLIDCLRLY